MQSHLFIGDVSKKSKVSLFFENFLNNVIIFRKPKLKYGIYIISSSLELKFFEAIPNTL